MPANGPRRPRPATKATKLVDEFRDRLAALKAVLPTLSRHAATKIALDLLSIVSEIEAARADLDPIKDPGASFDLADPDTAGRLVALALIAQDRVPLSRIARTYGSGVYAIYYQGDHPAYTVLPGTETPIYVGKADPQNHNARTPREQGPQLFGRLHDHRRMIQTVGDYAVAKGLSDPLRLDDFSARRLVCATNAQLVAERHLIAAFKPIWNSEIGLCWGISKHGDAARTRQNKRSPWDVMHPGRAWAMDETLEDSIPVSRITESIADHFARNPPYLSRDRIVADFLAAFAQNAAATPDESASNGEALDNAIANSLPSEE